MARDSKEEHKAAVVAENAATIVVAAAAVASPPGVLAAAGLGILPKALGVVVNKALRWKEADAAIFWNRLLNAPEPDGTTSEEIAGLIDSHADEPFVRESVLRSVKTLLDAVDPCIIVPLASLARKCIRERTSPDAFSRSTMRLFTELGRDELADLKRLLCWVLTETRTQRIVMIMSRNVEEVAKDQWEPIPWIAEMPRDDDGSGRKATRSDYAQLPGLNNPPRLFYLLRTNGLAMEKSGVSFASGPNTVMIDGTIAERLNEIVRLA